MGNRLAAIRAVIDHDTIATFSQPLLSSRCGCRREQCAEESAVSGSCLVNPGDTTLWNDQKMDWCLRGNITECDPLLPLGDNCGRDLT